MRFCDSCESRMEVTKEGYVCFSCGHRAPFEGIEMPKQKRAYSNPIYVVNSSDESQRVRRICPQCQHNTAYHWFSQSSGEHAGVKQERIVEHFKCTKCLHTWGESR